MLETQKPRLLVATTLAFLALVVVFHLASARAGYPHFRDIHLGTALEYAKGEIDLLRPMVVGFNASGTPTPQELPIWQALAALVFRAFGTWTGWANLLSLALFSSALWPLWHLGRNWLGERGAWWALLFFITQPLLVMMSGQASPDGFSLALSIWFLWVADEMIRSGRAAWWPATALLGVLSATAKLPLFMAVGLTSFFLLLIHAPRSGKAWGLLASAGLVAGVVFALWTHHTDGCHRMAVFPYSELESGKAAREWYIGTMGFRLNPANWAKGAWAALHCLFGSFALAALAGWALLFSRNRLGQIWFLGAFCTVLVFTHVVLVHRHYYMLFSGAVALLSASAALRIEELFDLRRAGRQVAAIGFAIVVLAMSIGQGLNGMEIVFNYDPYPARIAEAVRQRTAPEEKLLILGGGWGGEIFLRSGRQGLSIRGPQLFDDPETLTKLVSLGYTKLVMISESPLLHALQQINPGGADRQRFVHRQALGKTAPQWETLFESEDLLIKKLPARAE